MPTPWWAMVGWQVQCVNTFVRDVSEYYGIVPPVAKDCYLRVMGLEGDNPYANGWTI